MINVPTGLAQRKTKIQRSHRMATVCHRLHLSLEGVTCDCVLVKLQAPQCRYLYTAYEHGGFCVLLSMRVPLCVCVCDFAACVVVVCVC